jgi:probable HAF family extracellular repeat protein
MCRNGVVRLWIGWVLLLFGQEVQAGGLAQFIPLGDLPGGTFQSYGENVSADGSIVVGTGTNGIPAPGLADGFEFEAFRWTPADGLHGLGTSLGKRGTSAEAISGDGSVVAGFIFDEYPNRSAFRWTESTGMSRLSGCMCRSFDSVEELSYDGSVIVGRMYFFDGARAYRWTQATGAMDLGVLPGGGESSANDVSYDGTVVVGHSQTDRGFQAFRWTEQLGMVPLNSDPGKFSGANAVSADGAIVVGELGLEAARWTISDTGNSVLKLGDLPGGAFQSYAVDVSADGKVIVGNGTTQRGVEAFRWTEAAGLQSVESILTSLGVDMNGWRIQWVDAISADGSTLVGLAINPDGNGEGFLAVIPQSYVPEPSAILTLLVGSGLWMTMLRGRHVHRYRASKE